MIKINSTGNYVSHFFRIKVLNKKPGDTIETLFWSNLRLELRLKYDWYFKYRAALLQVKYPKYIVECIWGNEPAQGRTLQQIRESKIRAKKAKTSELNNKIIIAKKNWARLFPIEDDILYQKAIAKIGRLESELKSL